MPSPNSRYSGIEVATMTLSDGRTRVFLRRRMLPQPGTLALLSTHTVITGERLDLIAARRLGDPALWWRIADANGATDPAELTESAGRRLRITLPEGIPGAPDA